MCGIMVSIKFDEVSEFEEGFERIAWRGPDHSTVKKWGDSLFGFHRLSIMDTSDAGMQPFELDGWMLVCNGEIYNFLDLKEQVKYHQFSSGSDCEVILPLLIEKGVAGIALLDGEYAFVAMNKKTGQVIAARDELGVRPLFYGRRNGSIHFASEAKALLGMCDEIVVFKPGTYYDSGDIHSYHQYQNGSVIDNEEDALQVIHDNLECAVIKRLMSDVKVGFLLSGGLDSSLVCAIAAKYLGKSIPTFAVGMDKDAIDLKYARDVAEMIGSDHHEVIITMKEVFAALDNLIYRLETYDTTTIRASLGMILLCQYIRKETDVKVILTGEVSDELFGYKYTDFAPDANSFQEESLKRVDELHMYDVLRADRCISSCGLEGRVPFADRTFMESVIRVDASLKMNTRDVGKYLLRQAFAKDNLLPEHILWRQKAAFSDAVGHSMVDNLISYAETIYPNFTQKWAARKYPINTPRTAEAYWYREIFTKYYPKNANLIVDYWMPNQAWLPQSVNDPSARVLSNYDKSGQ